MLRENLFGGNLSLFSNLISGKYLVDVKRKDFVY